MYGGYVLTDWGDPNLPPGVTTDMCEMDYGDICTCGHRDHEHYDDEDVARSKEKGAVGNPEYKIILGACDIVGCKCEEYEVETKLGWLHPVNIQNIAQQIRADKEAHPETYKNCNKGNEL